MRKAVWLLLLCPVWTWADSDDDSAALSLPSAPVTATSTRPLSMTAEGALTAAAQSMGDEAAAERLSVDARYDDAVASHWRAVLAARLDADWAGAFGEAEQIGTLKEAYLSWRPGTSLLVDGGRINGRQGVAFGYNPTDFFRADALRSVISLDPDSLRENRLGTVMLRGQQLWDSGALTALVAPRLTSHASTAPLNPDFGATNAEDRWMLTLSQRIAAGWTPQWLVFGAAGQAPQLGMNLTALMNQSTVAYLEVSGGRSDSSLAQALGQSQRTSFRSRAAAGLTYSAANKLSLTLEYEYDGAASSPAHWAALQAGNPAVYGRYREYVQQQQGLPTPSNLFVYASWQDVLVRHWDLAAFWRLDLADHSQLPWVELRRHEGAFDLALRWQDAVGGATTDYGASAPGQTWQLVVDYYL